MEICIAKFILVGDAAKISALLRKEGLDDTVFDVHRLRHEHRADVGRKEVDPRGDVSYCGIISEKARALGGAVLKVMLAAYNR